MEEKTEAFNETQLKRVGFSEAYTPELQQKMKEGMPLIQHSFKKSYEGDQVEATLHLKKSAISDHYFLNKFDLQLQKDGQAETLKQTFYLSTPKLKEGDGNDTQKNRPENKYTLKEAYNLLAGRSVHKNLVNKEGQEYEAWVKMNMNNKLDNGNYELKQYTKNYGFDLETMLKNYPIKELTNEKYKQSLIDSLHRGNLQKATFVDKEGKEEKLFVSPNITLGAMNVYDQNKQRLTTEMLVNKQYIGKELAQDIQQRVSQQQNKEQKQVDSTSLKQDAKLDLRQKEVVKVKKQSIKQKVH